MKKLTTILGLLVLTTISKAESYLEGSVGVSSLMWQSNTFQSTTNMYESQKTTLPAYLALGGGTTLFKEKNSSIDLTMSMIFTEPLSYARVSNKYKYKPAPQATLTNHYYLVGTRLNYQAWNFNQFIEGGIGYSYESFACTGDDEGCFGATAVRFVPYAQVGALWGVSDKFKWGVQVYAIDGRGGNGGINAQDNSFIYLLGIAGHYNL
jgi:hypothetical protein